jgi:hypothetical protein
MPFSGAGETPRRDVGRDPIDPEHVGVRMQERVPIPIPGNPNLWMIRLFVSTLVDGIRVIWRDLGIASDSINL